MAEGDVTIHNKFKAELAKGNIDLDGDTFKMALLNGWTPNIDTDHFWSDISANEVSLTGYTAGGKALASLTVTENDTNDRFEWDFADVVWTGLQAGTVTRAAVYKDTGTPSTSPIICNIEIATNPNGNDYTIQIGATGLIHGT